MELYIESIEISNFKAFKRIKYDCNSSFNIIIGENNIGKSTIFEAIQLWHKCYDLLIKAKGDGFYQATGSNSYYLSYPEIYFLRLKNDYDMFFDQKNTTCIIIITISDKHHSYSLGVEIHKPRSMKNSFFRVRYVDQPEFNRFNDKLKELSVKSIALS